MGRSGEAEKRRNGDKKRGSREGRELMSYRAYEMISPPEADSS
jgi:hypothetical protein